MRMGGTFSRFKSSSWVDIVEVTQTTSTSSGMHFVSVLLIANLVSRKEMEVLENDCEYGDHAHPSNAHTITSDTRTESARIRRVLQAANAAHSNSGNAALWSQIFKVLSDNSLAATSSFSPAGNYKKLLQRGTVVRLQLTRGPVASSACLFCDGTSNCVVVIGVVGGVMHGGLGCMQTPGLLQQHHGPSY